MSRRSNKRMWVPGLWGMLVLTALPLTAGAATSFKESKQDRRLETQIPLEETRDFYRGLLTGLGYTIIAVNNAAPDAVEYEVRKQGQTTIVQIEMNQKTGKAIEVAVIGSLPQLLASEQEAGSSERRTPFFNAAAPLDQAVMAPTRREGDADPVIARGSRFSDRDQLRAVRLVAELDALPVGRARPFYRSALQGWGYQVGKARSGGAGQELTLEAGKDGQALVLLVRFDAETGKSLGVSASPLWREATSINPGQRDAVASTVHVTKSENPRRRRGNEGESLLDSAPSFRRPARGSRFSDRDQLRAARLVAELDALPVGRARPFYRSALQGRGYQVGKARSGGAGQELALEAGKDGQALVLLVRFDAETGKSLGVSASPLWREALDVGRDRLVSALGVETMEP